MSIPDPEQSMDRLNRAMEDYPRRLAELSAELAQAASRTVTGTAGDGQVEVTLTAGGEVQSVRVSQRTLREVDNHTLADLVRTAVNAGLDAADATLAVPGAEEVDAGEALAQFERRMDGLLDRLDAVDRALDRQAD